MNEILLLMMLQMMIMMMMLLIMMVMPMQGSRFYLLGLLEKVPSLQVMLDFATVTYCDVC